MAPYHILFFNCAPTGLPEIDLESGNGSQKRAAVYLRISKADGQQTEENQQRELREFLEKEGYELAGEFVDHESGQKVRREREAFDRMFEVA